MTAAATAAVNADIPPFLDRRPLVYSYTILNAYQNCAHAMSRRYIVKDIPYVETDAMRIGNEAHAALEQRVRDGKPLPDTMEQWEALAAPLVGYKPKVELKLAVSADGLGARYFGNDAWLRGRADVAIISAKRAYILDWKTGNPNYEDSFELEINALLLKANFPELDFIHGAYGWLRENRISRPYNLSHFNTTWNEIRKIVRQIEHDRGRGKFDKKQSGLCKHCDVRDCEHNKKPR